MTTTTNADANAGAAAGDNTTTTRGRRLVSVDRILLTLLKDFALLLTFGAVCPPLAAAQVISMISYTTFLEVKVGRFLQNSFDQRLFQNIREIERNCEDMEVTPTSTTAAAAGTAGGGTLDATVGVATTTRIDLLQKSLRLLLWPILIVSAGFYALFLFDTLGNAQGFQASYWVLISVPLGFPLLVSVAYYTCHHIRFCSSRCSGGGGAGAGAGRLTSKNTIFRESEDPSHAMVHQSDHAQPGSSSSSSSSSSSGYANQVGSASTNEYDATSSRHGKNSNKNLDVGLEMRPTATGEASV